MESNHYRTQKKLTLASFLAELPNFVAIAVLFILTGNAILLIDLLDSLTITLKEYTNRKKALAFDAAILFSALACSLLSRYPFSVYISPALSILIAVLFNIEAVRRIRRSVSEVTERALDEESIS